MIRVGRRTEPGAQYIGRGSPLGNPFVTADRSDTERDRVCEEYDAWLAQQIAYGNQEIIAELNRLARLASNGDVTLGCYCTPKRCHGDAIKTILESWRTGNMLTEKAAEFVKHNAKHAVVAAEILTKEKKRIYSATDQENRGFSRYWFENKTIRTLSSEDVASLPGMPRWATP